MKNPLRRSRKKIFLGGEGMRLLWKMFPQAAFFEVYVPAKGEGVAPDLPLIIESTESRLVEPYTKMFYRLFTEREAPIFRLLFMNVNCDPSISRRVAANLAITLASEDLVTYLIDLDMKEPALHDVFHVDRNPGMVEYLLKGAEADDIIRDTGVPELKFVPSGRLLTDPNDVLSVLGWSNTLDRLIPPGVVGLIYAGTGKGFDLSELMPEVDGVLLLFSSGEKINRWVKKELKKVKKRSDVVGVIWTNPMEYPFRKIEPQYIEESERVDEEVPAEEGVSVLASQQFFMEKEERAEEEGGDGEPEMGSGESDVKGEDEMEAKSADETKGGREAESEESSEVAEKDKVLEVDAEKREAGGGESEETEGRNVWTSLLFIIPLLLLGWVLYSLGVFSPVEPQPETATSQVDSQASPLNDVGGTGTGVESPPATIDRRVEVAPGGSSPQVNPLPYSLILASYRDAAAAEKGRKSLLEAGFDAYLVPLELPGIGRWTRLMAGQYHDKSGAATILEEIEARSEFEDGRIVSSPFSYLLGEFGSMEDAKEACKMVEETGLDPYIVWTGREERSFSLYLGAFENELQAGVVENLLGERNLKGELTDRKGFHI